MKQITTIRTALTAVALGATGTAMAAMPMMYEEKVAHQEEASIIKTPIAGVKNSHWFNYQTDVIESKKELASDMHRASDIEDRRDAWGEYAHELHHERKDYVNYMAKRGYRVPHVYFEDM